MRYFVKPADRKVVVIGDDGKRESDTVVFHEWFELMIGTSQSIMKSAVTLRQAQRAIEVVISAEVGSRIALEEEDWKLVCSVLGEPKGNPWVNRQLVDWIDELILKATTKPTETVAHAAE